MTAPATWFPKDAKRPVVKFHGARALIVCPLCLLERPVGGSYNVLMITALCTEFERGHKCQPKQAA